MIGMSDESEGANMKNSTSVMTEALLWIMVISSLGSMTMALIYFVILPSKWVFFVGCPFFGLAGALLWFRAGRTISKKT